MDNITEYHFKELASQINFIIRNNESLSFADFSTYYNYFEFLYAGSEYIPSFMEIAENMAQYLYKIAVKTESLHETQSVFKAKKIIEYHILNHHNLNNKDVRNRVKPSEK